MYNSTLQNENVGKIYQLKKYKKNIADPIDLSEKHSSGSAILLAAHFSCP